MPGFNIQVDDLVLYFKDDNNEDAYRWVPLEVYTDKTRKLPKLEEAWRGDVLSEKRTRSGDVYYVSNLSCLIDPHTAGDIGRQPVDVATLGAAPAAKATPGDGDLVIVPNHQDENNKLDEAFLLSREAYLACPVLTRTDIPDIHYMANEQGVVLANIRKFVPLGISCYLINLQGLISHLAPPTKAPGAGKKARKKAKVEPAVTPAKKARKKPKAKKAAKK